MLADLIVRALWGNGHRLLARIARATRGRRALVALHSWYQHEMGSSIAWNASFASEPCFPHGERSIFISGGARLGRNCVIFQQVTIGSNTVPSSKGFGAPVIGDNCYIGAGAKIIGAVRVGNNVRVAANAVVVSDVPDNTVVAVSHHELRPTTKTDNRFYSWQRGSWCYFNDGRYVKVTDLATLTRLAEFGNAARPSAPDESQQAAA